MSEDAGQTTRQYWRYTNASEFLDIPIGTLRQMVARKLIPHIRLGPRTVRFDPAMLRAWVDACSIRVPSDD